MTRYECLGMWREDTDEDVYKCYPYDEQPTGDTSRGYATLAECQANCVNIPSNGNGNGNDNIIDGV